MSAVFFADESSVFTASDDGIARMWDSSTGECKQELSTVKSGTSPHLRWGARGQGLDPSPAPSNPPWGFSSTSAGVVWVDDKGAGAQR
jgi:WD40 repeat protein